IDRFEYSRNRGALTHNNPLSRILYARLAENPALHARLLAVQNRQRSPLDVFDIEDVKQWTSEAVSRGEQGVMEALMQMSQRGKEIRAEMALRQRLAE